MSSHYQRKLFPVLQKLLYWRTLNYCSKSLNNFPVTASEEKKLKRKKSSVKEDECACSDNSNSIDNFTDSLVQEKCRKWEMKAIEKSKKEWTVMHTSVQQLDSEETQYQLGIKSKTGKKTEITQDLIKSFLEECLENRMFPEETTLLALAQSCAQHGDKDSINVIKKISELLASDESNFLSCYDHYLAEALWRSGNIEGAMNMYWCVYEGNKFLRKSITSMLQLLIKDSIANKGEAVLVLVIQFSKKFVDSYSDYTLLSYVWQYCFLSEWHSDNQIADNLLEEYNELRNIITSRVNFITNYSFSAHRVDIVQRLLEILLKYEMKQQCELVLRSLFDYACSQGDVGACSAIMKSAKELDITLTTAQNTKFLYLFCSQDPHHVVKPPEKQWPSKPPEFNLKF